MALAMDNQPTRPVFGVIGVRHINVTAAAELPAHASFAVWKAIARHPGTTAQNISKARA